MKKKALLAALILAAALILTACAQDPEKHPLVAKWTQRAQDGRTQFTYSFEAVGDAEYYLWTWDDEENRLMQREYYWGEYEVNDEAGTIALHLRDDDEHEREEAYAWSIAEDGKTLTLKNDETELVLERAAENSAKVR